MYSLIEAFSERLRHSLRIGILWSHFSASGSICPATSSTFYMYEHDSDHPGHSIAANLDSSTSDHTDQPASDQLTQNVSEHLDQPVSDHLIRTAANHLDQTVSGNLS